MRAVRKDADSGDIHVSQCVEFSIKDNLPPSMNEILRMHWKMRRKRAEDFGWLIKSAVSRQDVRQLKAWKELGLRVSVQMRISNPQLFDEDGLGAMAKWPLDLLVSFGWLRNDDPKCVTFEKPEQRLGPREIMFRISPVEESKP